METCLYVQYGVHIYEVSTGWQTVLSLCTVYCIYQLQDSRQSRVLIDAVQFISLTSLTMFSRAHSRQSWWWLMTVLLNCSTVMSSWVLPFLLFSRRTVWRWSVFVVWATWVDMCHLSHFRRCITWPFLLLSLCLQFCLSVTLCLCLCRSVIHWTTPGMRSTMSSSRFCRHLCLFLSWLLPHFITWLLITWPLITWPVMSPVYLLLCSTCRLTSLRTLRMSTCLLSRTQRFQLSVCFTAGCLITCWRRRPSLLLLLLLFHGWTLAISLSASALTTSRFIHLSFLFTFFLPLWRWRWRRRAGRTWTGLVHHHAAMSNGEK